MENEIHTKRASLLLLNGYCLLDIFEFLQIEDSMNLAECCSRLNEVAQHKFKKISTFHLDCKMAMKGEKYLHRVFNHIGQYLSSIKIDCSESRLNLSEIIGSVINDFKNIKSLRIDKWKGETYQNVQAVYNFDNVELLTMCRCDFDKTNFHCSFLQNFHKLKSVNCLFCFNISDALKAIFGNNKDIASFVDWFNGIIEPSCLELTTKIEKLCFPFRSFSVFNLSNTANLLPILKFDRLTKLKLYCEHDCIRKLFRELPTKGIIEELVLESVSYFDIDDLYEIWPTFEKLELLVIELSCDKQNSSIHYWPTKLKRLRLSHCEMTSEDFISIVQQLKSIESIDLNECRIVKNNETYFNDVVTLSRHILDVIDLSDRKQRLDLVLPDCVKPSFYHSKEFVIDSNLLRILNRPFKRNPLKIDIYFPLL